MHRRFSHLPRQTSSARKICVRRTPVLGLFTASLWNVRCPPRHPSFPREPLRIRRLGVRGMIEEYTALLFIAVHILRPMGFLNENNRLHPAFSNFPLFFCSFLTVLCLSRVCRLRSEWYPNSYKGEFVIRI